jgi:multiple sugar transport system substrate-binding protein
LLRSIRALAVALLAVAVAACGGPATSGQGGGTTRITVVLFGDAIEVAGYGDLVDAFTDANPDVEVALSPVATQDDLLARLTTSFAGGNPPDVFLLNFRRYGQFAAQGAIDPAQPYLDASEVLDEADFADAPMDAFRFDGTELTCMPQNLSSLVVYYNRDLFEAAGVPLPAEGWTWDDLLEAGEALTGDGTYGIGIEPKLIRLAPFVWSNGGELVDDEDRPTRLTVDDGPAREALDFLLDLSLVHGVVPPDAEELSESSEARFLRGTLGMLFDSRVAVPTLRTIEGFDWDVAPMPVAPGGEPVSILHTDAYCLGAGAGNPEASWRFVEFAMSAEGQEILAASGRTVPSRLDVARSPTFLEPDLPPASSQVYLDAEPTLRATPRTATWSRVEKEGDALLLEVFYGRVEREAGIARLVEDTTPLFALEGGT